MFVEKRVDNNHESRIKRLSDEEQFSLVTAVKENNIVKLKQLLNSLRIDKFDDRLSHILLYEAFQLGRIEVFNFLLSLQVCNLDARDDRGATTLMHIMTVVCPENDYFALELIKKGASVRCFDAEHNTLLHYAVGRECCRLARFLIEKGVDVNVQNYYGYTALHRLFLHRFSTSNSSDVWELLSILLWNGADLSLCDKGGDTPLELLLSLYESQNEPPNQILEVLFYYSFDGIVPCKTVFEMIRLKLPLFDQVIEHIDEITIDYHFLKTNIYWSVFSMDVKYLKILMDRFDYVILELLAMNVYNFYTNTVSLESVDFLLQSHLAFDVITFIKEIRILSLIEVYYNNMYQKLQISEETVMELIYYLLSYGLEVYENDLEAVYNNFGPCELFTFLLHMDIQNIFNYKKDAWISLLYDFGKTDIETFLANPYLYTWKNLKQLLFHFSHQRLKELCRDKLYDNKKIIEKVESLPQVPLLVELARNVFRNLFVQKFNIISSKRFYSLLKRLPISSKHEKIITLETKLYC